MSYICHMPWASSAALAALASMPHRMSLCRCEAKTSGMRRPRKSEEATVEACLILVPDPKNLCMMTMMSEIINGTSPGSMCCSKTQQCGADPRDPLQSVLVFVQKYCACINDH